MADAQFEAAIAKDHNVENPDEFQWRIYEMDKKKMEEEVNADYTHVGTVPRNEEPVIATDSITTDAINCEDNH
ncbi:hypothetical protein LguiA_016275 [Lonicera macranthoides]